MSSVIAFSILTFTVAYLALNTPEKHGPLQIGHYLLTHVFILFTGYVGFATAATDESLANLLGGFTSSYAYMVYLVGAYFLIMMLVKGLELFSQEG